MNKRRFLLNKLVRDEAATQWADRGIIMQSRILSDDEKFLEAVIEKMIEELQEMLSAGTYEELIEEVGDFEEMIGEFKKITALTQDVVDAVHAKKVTTKGGHTKRIFCDYIDVPETETELISYYEANKERFPELNPETNDAL
jgi:predicted house-cleaning noncanonical NTP pyrophosphatase (MazG superfamily)